MGVVLGVDLGGSLTKIVGMRSGNTRDGEILDMQIIDMIKVKAADQVTSVYGGIGRFLHSQKIVPSDVSAIYLTGVGSSFIDGQVLGIETRKMPEFDAIGRGALRLSKLDEALVISMGTGTAFVKAASGGMVHIGGTGLGGGTILGLASQLSCGSDIDAIVALAGNGSLGSIDLLVGDITNRECGSLALNMTASNFGKLRGKAPDADVALGIINMVFETIGMLALFAMRNDAVNNVVLTGTLATFPQAKTVFGKFGELSGKNFIIPDNAVFATALGSLPT